MRQNPNPTPFDPLAPGATRMELPQPSERPPVTTRIFPAAWHPPALSLASRDPHPESKGRFDVTLVDPLTNRIVLCESMLEGRLWYMLRIDPQVAWIWDQPRSVFYFGENGEIRRHTFDFLVVLHNGRRIAIAVKPQAHVVSSGIEDTLERIRTQSGTLFADTFLLRTEAHITTVRATNARLIFEAFCQRDTEHVEAVHAFVRTLAGAVPIRDLARASGLGPEAFNAIVCLIGDGVLKLHAPVCISPDAFVTPATAH
ncbi:hypothetical protein IC232_07900 [Microvirga sp. BT688]|uniref:TnsA endonuclease N-terminal domain-containing protein n=1 Tax=Microvirga sp. TaxID=1873136 RepID=UPI001684AF31|nr:TnsA endonuclease N-terminal domain-containing protein [Microvirga sp.]MBD2746623.1 hypothetical protein [Microvirga sp.]